MIELIDSQHLKPTEYTPMFIEGAVLAANLTPKALQPQVWIEPLVEFDKVQIEAVLTRHFEQQYAQLMACQYDLNALLGAQSENAEELLADFAEGFMTVWPVIEAGWNEIDVISDGTVRMLQALLTTMMLAIDEENTHEQMKQAGIENPPKLADLAPQLNVMINEVAKAADDALQGMKAQAVNPFKTVGRNDECPCGSGKKYKQCCLH
ncbi:MAG: SEC-C metal-binding domain-containing protein [Vibrio sp.]